MTGSFYVGQKVMLSDGDRRPAVETEIIRVGRTVVYVKQHGRERGFRIADGLDHKHGPNTPGLPATITTLEDYFGAQQRQGAKIRLRELGFIGAGYGDYKQSTELLLEMIELLEREENKR